MDCSRAIQCPQHPCRAHIVKTAHGRRSCKSTQKEHIPSTIASCAEVIRPRKEWVRNYSNRTILA